SVPTGSAGRGARPSVSLTRCTSSSVSELWDFLPRTPAFSTAVSRSFGGTAHSFASSWMRFDIELPRLTVRSPMNPPAWRPAVRARRAEASGEAIAPGPDVGRSPPSRRDSGGGSHPAPASDALDRAGGPRCPRRYAPARPAARAGRTRRRCGSARRSFASLLRYGFRIGAGLVAPRALRLAGSGQSCGLGPLLLDVSARRREDGTRTLRTDPLDLGHRLLVRGGQLLGRLEAVLIDQLGTDVPDTRDRDQRRPRTPRLVLGLRFTAHVETPPREPRRQADVLPLLPDRERQLVVRDDHLHRPLVLVHDDLGDLCRRQRTADVLRGIGRPRHDVDLLTAQLLHDRLHPRPAHSHARTNGVDIAVMRHDRELRPAAWLACRSLHLDNALVDLGNLLLEELHQQARVGAREDDLRSLAAQLHVQDESPDAVALPVALAGDLLLLRKDGVGPAEVHDDVLLLEALHDAREELPLPPLELVVDDIALRVAHALVDVLLRRLCRDAAELLRRELGEQLVTDLGVGIELGARLGEPHLVLGILHHLDDRLDLEELD